MNDWLIDSFQLSFYYALKFHFSMMMVLVIMDEYTAVNWSYVPPLTTVWNKASTLSW